MEYRWKALMMVILMMICSKVDISTTKVVRQEKKNTKDHSYEKDLDVKYMGLVPRTAPQPSRSYYENADWCFQSALRPT